VRCGSSTKTFSAVAAVSAVAFVWALAVGCGRSERTTPAARLDILLVTIDTFRADRVGIGITPAIDRLADSGIRFTHARSAVPLTLPSHATILTGLLPPAHSVRENGVDVLDEAHVTVAHLLKNAGYRTAAFVGAFVLDRRFGLAQGFDTYDDQITRDPNATERLEAERPATLVVDRALGWLAAQAEGPFFVWLHLYDPHAPYVPPPEFLARAKTAYDGEIAFADAQLARVFDWLRTKGIADRTLIIVAGDHGEGLGDHGERTHGMLLYDSTLRVPLIVVVPGQRAERRDEPVSLADIAPTILNAAQVSGPREMNGRDLLEEARLKPVATSDDATERVRGVPLGNVRLQPDHLGSVRLQPNHLGSVRFQPDLYSETDYPRVAGWTPLQALTDGRWKAIRAGDASELYDLENDQREQRDLAKTQPAIAGAMAARIETIRASRSAAPQSISSEANERLRALGYVANSVASAPRTGAASPASAIATWNAFEDALNALNAHRSEALPQLRALAAQNPEGPVFQTTLAAALKEAGRPADALSVYRKAAKRWPTDAALLHDLAAAAREAALRTSGDAARRLMDEAVRADQAAVAVSPRSAVAHNGLGLLAIDAGRARDAAPEFERATALDPNNASYWSNLGNARRGLGDAAAAEQAYRRALAIDARSADAANGIGVLLVEAHRAGDATQWFERALQAAPDFTEARLNLGIALQESGDRTRAAEQYRRVLAAHGAAREKDAAAKLLASIGAPQ
jgi:arylsulfatase A-like enzyme/thioredoxin-like negative regulator of GroEL